MDVILVKSLRPIVLVLDLEKIFEMTRRYDLKFNSSRCVFRVYSEKFLRYMVIRGIKAKSKKV